MRIIKDGEKFMVDNWVENKGNKTVPLVATLVYVGSYKVVSEPAEDSSFSDWLSEHDLTYEEFVSMRSGQLKPAPFFPLKMETQVSRIIHFYPSKNQGQKGGGVRSGILKIMQVNYCTKEILNY